MSDNGPQFVSEEFGTFLKLNGIRHIRCSPYHSSNGAAERFVQTFKQAMKAGAPSTPLLSQRLSSFLLTYRATPDVTTNTPPSQLFIGRRLRTRFDLIRPDQEKRVNDKQATQKASHDAHSRIREFDITGNGQELEYWPRLSTRNTGGETRSTDLYGSNRIGSAMETPHRPPKRVG